MRQIANLFLLVGHIRLHRVTALDREEMKKKEKEARKLKAEDEEVDSKATWIKYTLGLKHQVGWKGLK